ncbi:MupG family TIM beta-alpha barrel fold protein [Alkalihalophilus pseudofirmus]|uniref:MupG family TIM beta-alpha barrel fold protein n=2 Tax=Alkalihalophilus TaxID=2893060 RepID=A0AAJ2KVW9_ALKPS|nr:MupG family TIM beta-alpha barrel fold protein [Alkalihalophilus pseudofirmus]MDV2884858.1 MupG family TIM beta-alpha barrel fold protein [Alkalihalophilus pseudofirmus]
MRGFSVFLGQQTYPELKNYLLKMKEAGFQTVFTSLHIPEDDPTEYKEELQQLGQLTTSLSLELVADISPASLEHLGYTYEQADELTDWGISGLRIDYGIDGETIVSLSRKMKVVLNASTMTKKGIKDLIKGGLVTQNVEAWHNYYPRPETGLDKEAFIQKNEQLRHYGIMMAAFVPGDARKRGPMYKGLPTLEKHRDISPFAAAIELLRVCKIDKVLIGDPDLSEAAIQAFKRYDQGILTFRTNLYPLNEDVKALVNQTHTQRVDAARDVIRSQNARIYVQENNINVLPERCHARPRGTITIDNETNGRYEGELQVTKTTLTPHSGVNVVGNVILRDELLLDLLQPGEVFVLS